MEGKSLEGRPRYSILSSMIALGDAGGSSSKGDVTLYKDVGGSIPKSCKVHFVAEHKTIQIGSYLRQFPPSADTLNPLSLR
jgi:hypothetical protein